MVFPVVMYGCESWTISKAECWRIDTWTVVLEKTLWESLGLSRWSNQSILKEILPEYSLKGLMLKLKLQYFGHLMQRTGSLEQTLTLGKIESRGEGDNKGWVGWMASLTQWTWVWASSRCWWWTGKPGLLQPMGSHGVWQDWATELNWTHSSIIA